MADMASAAIVPILVSLIMRPPVQTSSSFARQWFRDQEPRAKSLEINAAAADYLIA